MSVVSSLAAASSSMSTTSSSISSTSSVGVAEGQGQGSGASHVRNLLFSPPDSDKVGTINFTFDNLVVFLVLNIFYDQLSL